MLQMTGLHLFFDSLTKIELRSDTFLDAGVIRGFRGVSHLGSNGIEVYISHTADQGGLIQ